MSAFDVTYTAIVISHSGRMMFVGTSVGTIRAMKYPLPLQKEFNEYQAHCGPITKVRATVSPGAQSQIQLSIDPPGPALHIPPSSLQSPSIFSLPLFIHPAKCSINLYWLLILFV